MNFISVLVLFSFASEIITIQFEDTYCCNYAKFKEQCHEVCMELTKANKPAYGEQLSSLLDINCPKNSKDMEEFWNCLSIYNDSADAWYGNECCELAMTDSCRTSCLKSQNREELFGACTPHYEEALHSCVFKHENRQKCCKRPDVGSFCRHRCVKAFKTETGPSMQDISAMKSACDSSIVQCMKNYSDSVRLKSLESSSCCRYAKNCRESCVRIISTEMKDATIINRIRKSCGEIVPHEPLWKCFLTDRKPIPNNGPFGTKLQCCSKAASNTCKQLCSELYGNPWSEPSKWNQFERQCKHSSSEVDLQQCLEEVSEPCTLGCQNLSFCTNFNDRPTSLFRNCNADSDEMARHLFNEWSSGKILFSAGEVLVKNVLDCEPAKWKAVACSLQIKPCSSNSGKSIICKSDCLSLLSKCADSKQFSGNMKREELCEQFSPSDLQENCISLSEYTQPRNSVTDEGGVTKPCHPNPCEENQLCVINRKNCDSDEKCTQYRCLPGCKMGHGSNFIVSRGSVVKVADPVRGEGCFKSCICSTSGELSPCVNQPCTEIQKSCQFDNELKEHGSNFDIDCNFCTCYGGNVTCTNRNCGSSESVDGDYTGMPCNCKSVYEPVCGEDGRTYSSSCVALCLDQKLRSITNGSCLLKNPCKSNTCQRRERCVHTPRTCLTNFKNCRQFECLPRYRKCVRLLKSATSLLETQVYNSHRHRYSEHEKIQSSSYFFSNSALLSDNSGLCDSNDDEFENICELKRSKHRKVAYTSPCKKKCSSKIDQQVCGQDYVTYAHSCMAETNGVLVDHPGACKARQLTKKDKKPALVCTDIQCPSLSRSGCSTVRPPGTCCPLCGAMLRVLFDKDQLTASRGTPWHGPITVRDVVWLLRSQLHVLECQLYGYLTDEGDLAIIIVSTSSKPSEIQEKACIQEAQRLSNLINHESPTLTTYLILSPLTAASLTPSSTGGTGQIKFSQLILLITLTFHFIAEYWIT